MLEIFVSIELHVWQFCSNKTTNYNREFWFRLIFSDFPNQQWVKSSGNSLRLYSCFVAKFEWNVKSIVFKITRIYWYFWYRTFLAQAISQKRFMYNTQEIQIFLLKIRNQGNFASYPASPIFPPWMWWPVSIPVGALAILTIYCLVPIGRGCTR